MIKQQIPKIIHYCWFGHNAKPADVVFYIDSWKKYMPDYQIIEWNEQNFNIDDSISYVKEAYIAQKWAFVSDYVRLFALYNYGGIYFDTDVQVFRSFDPLLCTNCFFGFESKDYLSTAVMACKPNHWFIKEFMDSYNNRSFIKNDGTYDVENTNVVALTSILCEYGLWLNGKKQNVKGVSIYPQSFFSANDFRNIFNHYRYGTFAYHHYNASWYNKKNTNVIRKRVRHYILGIARNVLGTSRLYHLRHGK